MIHPAQQPIGYQEIADMLRAEITAGRYRPGDRLPSEGYLSQTHGVATKTARAALQMLRREGLAELVRGYGVVVRHQPALQDIIPEPGSSVWTRMPTPAERARYDVPEGVPLLVIEAPDGLQDLYPGHAYRVRVT